MFTSHIQTHTNPIRDSILISVYIYISSFFLCVFLCENKLKKNQLIENIVSFFFFMSSSIFLFFKIFKGRL